MAAFLISSGRFYGPPLGTIETYAAGTTTPLATYTTQAASVANPTTINIPASGYVQMWGGAGLSYRFIVKDSAGATVYDQDNITGISSAGDAATLESTLAGTGGAGMIGYSSAIAPVAGTVGARLRTEVWANDAGVGAVGDCDIGTGLGTDDTAALQAGLDRAGSRVAGSIPTLLYGMHNQLANRAQGVFRLAPGKAYKITDTLYVPPGVEFDLNGSAIYQATANKDAVALASLFLGWPFYGRFFDSVHDGLILGVGSGTSTGRGLWLEACSNASIQRITVQGFKHGIVQHEGQYTKFEAVRAFFNKVGWYATARPTELSLATVDNEYIACSAAFNTHIGVWSQCESFGKYFGFDASRNGVVDVLVGSHLFGQVRSISVTAGGTGYTPSTTLPITFTEPAGATVTGSIVGTTLSISVVSSGAVAVGQYLAGEGVREGTKVVSGSGLLWTVSQPQTVAYTTITCGGSGVALQGYVETNSSGVVTAAYVVDAGLRYSSVTAAVSGGGGSGATLSCSVVDDEALGDWPGIAVISRGRNVWYALKTEHTTTDRPLSGYAVMVVGNTARYNRFEHLTVQRQGSGPRQYYRWLWSGGLGTHIEMPADPSDLPDALVNPAVAFDPSIFRSVVYGGLSIRWGQFVSSPNMMRLGVNAGGSPSYDGFVSHLGFDGTGGVQSYRFYARSASPIDFALVAGITGEAQDRLRILTDGSILSGGGSSLPSVRVRLSTIGVSADRGDSNVTLVPGVDMQTQRFATTFTANRTVTLSTTGAVNSDKFRIVRTGLGAFTLDVGGLKTIPSGTAATVDVEYDGAAWRLVGYQTL